MVLIFSKWCSATRPSNTVNAWSRSRTTSSEVGVLFADLGGNIGVDGLPGLESFGYRLWEDVQQKTLRALSFRGHHRGCEVPLPHEVMAEKETRAGDAQDVE